MKNRHDQLPIALPPGTMELPESGWVRVPRELVRDVFPDWEYLLDRGWIVLVNRRGELSWHHRPFAPGICAFCGKHSEAEWVARYLHSGVPGENAQYSAIAEFICECGARWLQEVS
jgi:hypothetical protein